MNWTEMDAAFEVDEPGVHADPSLRVVEDSDREWVDKAPKWAGMKS